ncbi:MAG TPA: Rossmann-like and DUF2520 domain-containing protein [Longimicrobiales bacterium]|nr:Rossmann-like and DUF2520 domain-containing protein [Longimicrobiales bacterium]
MSERIAIVGPGRMGLALGSALTQAREAEQLVYFGRSADPPPHPLFDGGSSHVSYRAGVGPIPEGITALILAVPDDVLHSVANEVALAGQAPRGCVALHLSGALSTDVLAPLHGSGYSLGSLHPLQTVADPWSGADRLRGCAYALAGEPPALVVGRQIVAGLDGHALIVPPALRPLYHAAAVFASNYVVAAAAVVARTLAEAGVREQDAIAAALPLMRGTLDNVEQLGFGAALTGPVARGDIDTVRLHLSRLSPRERGLYSALGRETLRLARAAGLDPARADAIESLLGD